MAPGDFPAGGFIFGNAAKPLPRLPWRRERGAFAYLLRTTSA